MLNTLQIEPLEDRRRANRLTLLYKIIHENVAMPMEELDLQRNQRATRGLATQDWLFITRSNTTELKNHFQPEQHQNGTGLHSAPPQLTQYPHLRVGCLVLGSSDPQLRTPNQTTPVIWPCQILDYYQDKVTRLTKTIACIPQLRGHIKQNMFTQLISGQRLFKWRKGLTHLMVSMKWTQQAFFKFQKHVW